MVSRKIENFLDDQECDFLLSLMKSTTKKEERLECADFKMPKTIAAKVQELIYPRIMTCAIQVYEVGHRFSPHRDVYADKRKVRTHSMSILLNNEFEGGELYIEGEPARQNKGDLVMFHPNQMHWVEGVWKGTRKVLTVWGVKNED